MEKTIYDGDVLDKYSCASYRFLSVTSCGMHVNASHITKRELGRSDYHLLYVESGEMVCKVGEEIFKLHSGGYVIYPPYAPQKYEQNGGVCYWVHFSGTACAEIVTDCGLKHRSVFLGEGASKAVTDIFERMIYRYVTVGHADEMALSAELLALLAEFRYQSDAVRPQLVDERICNVITHIHKHYFEVVDLEACAAVANLSLGRFMHLFKAHLGISPNAYIQKIRLEKAAELLVFSEEKVAEIAYKTGFQDPLYFSRCFKNCYGISPSSFRREKGKGVPRQTASSGCD